MLSETPCQKRPFPITAKKHFLCCRKRPFPIKYFLTKVSDRMGLSKKCCPKWFYTPRRRQTPSGSTQGTVHAALSPSTQQTTVQQHTATPYTAEVSVLAYTHRSSTAAASLLGLLLGNTLCVTFVSSPSSAVRSSRRCSSIPRWQTQERAV